MRTILVEAEKQAIQREKAAHDTFEKVSESIKLFNKERAVLTRKNVDYGAKYHQEIWQSYEDLELFRAAYEKAAKEYDIYIKKHDDATKHPKSGLRALKNLVKGTDSEERLQKLSRKLKAKERGMNDCRNDYILALKAVNGLHGRYYKEDLPLYLEKMDGHFYKALSKAYEQFLIADQLYFDQIKGSSIKLGEGIPQLVRTVDAAYFVKENDAVFKMPADIKFEMCDPDKSCEISLDEVTKVSLGQKLGILLRRDDLLLETQSCLEKQVDAIGQLAELYTENPKGTASPYEQQTELQNQIDLIKCQRWTLFVKIKTLEDLASILKLYIVAPIAPTADEEAQLASPTKVKIVTAFTATQLDKEVSVGEGEEVIVLAADIDGWTKVKVAKSSFIGIIPTSCIGKVTLRERGNSLKPAQSSNGPPVVRTLYGMIALIVDYTSIDETELSFKAGDIIECVDIFPEEEWWVGRLQRNGEIGAFPVNFTRDWEAVAAQYAKGHGRVASATTTLPNVVEKVVQQVQQDSKSGNVASPVTAKDFADFKDLMANATKQIQAKAIYSYDATCKGELSIVAGEIITVTSQDIGSEDWWEGTGQKGQGQFPKSYVQVVEANSRTPSNHPKRGITI